MSSYLLGSVGSSTFCVYDEKDCKKSEYYGKPFYYLLGNVDILFIYKISYKVYKISNKIY